MKALIKFARLILLILLIPASLAISHNSSALYMILSGIVQLGEPIYVDELAPTITDALLTISAGALIILAIIATRSYLRNLESKHTS